MTVRELIKELTDETYENEKDYRLTIVDENGKEYEIAYYDWCDQKIRIQEA